jgi:hypothetical protein
MSQENEYPYKQRAELQAILHVLSDKPIGWREHINAIAKMAHLHHQTAKRVIENIFVIQKIAPIISLYYLENGRIEMEIKDIPAYFYENLKSEERVLIKLYLSKAFFGSKVSIELLSKEEQKLIPKLKNELLVHHDASLIGLSAAGVELAFQKMEDFMNLHDLMFQNLEMATSQIERIPKLEEEEALLLEKLEDIFEQLSAITPEILKKSPTIEQGISSFLSSPTARYIEKISDQINRIKQILPRYAYRSIAEDHTSRILP